MVILCNDDNYRCIGCYIGVDPKGKSAPGDGYKVLQQAKKAKTNEAVVTKSVAIRLL